MFRFHVRLLMRLQQIVAACFKVPPRRPKQTGKRHTDRLQTSPIIRDAFGSVSFSLIPFSRMFFHVSFNATCSQLQVDVSF